MPHYLLLLIFLVHAAVADIYLHNMRGSNNRNCRNDNNDRRRNANRLFDSQNNDKGGYSCPRAYPFPAGSAGTATVNEYGKITGSTTGDHIDTDTFFYYEGTSVSLEWTSQHACGANGNQDCRMILQYMCNTDAPSAADTFLSSMLENQYIRDGTPIKNDDGDNTNDEATTTIPAASNSANCNNNDCVMDGRYGFQEPFAYYSYCTKRTRNFGLFTADQLPVSGTNQDRAINTRQNPDGSRYGLECPEERDYYPYWSPTPWKDIAIGVPASRLDHCKSDLASKSQNVQNKCYCDLSAVTNPAQPFPITQAKCTQQAGTWKCGGKWGLSEPDCFAMPYSRDNHLGNTAGGRTYSYNWTLPSPPSGQDTMRCVFRIRYNVTTGDFPQDIGPEFNCADNAVTCASPILDRDQTNHEPRTYLHYFDESNERYKLSMAVNTNQHARTFQDRSYAFDIKKRTSEIKSMCKKDIVNLNVRGKRGNIVQVYPAVEYDFVPQDVQVEAEDCMHIQWIGSDYNPNRNPNDGEGGPYNPNNVNEAKADRSNMVQMTVASTNYGTHVQNLTNPFFTNSDGEVDVDMVKKFAFIDQSLGDCDTFTQLKNRNPNNRQARERDPRNCGKLNAAATPYFKGGVIKVYNQGSHKFLSTRNNNFSNRSQKLKIVVSECTYNCSGGSKLSGGAIAGITIGTLAAAGLLGFLAYAFLKKKDMLGHFRAPGGKSIGKPVV